MLVAVVIFTLVVAGIGTSFVAVMRLSRRAMAEAELSVRMRELREKLLFHVAPPHGGRVWAGLLSGERGVEAGVKIRTPAEGYDLATGVGVPQTIELVRHSGRVGFVNDGDRTDDAWDHRWLAPGGFAMLPEAEALGYAQQDSRFFYTITLEASAQGVTRRERIVVPLFGRAQLENEGNVFDD